jgi:hypothetical protein
MIRFLALGLRRMKFGICFLFPRPRKINYLYIKLNLFETDMMLQLEISHGLVKIVVIDRF